MHVRIKITLLFTLIMFLLLSLICGYIYYSSFNIRLENSKAQLTNWALTTSHKLNKPDIYDQKFMRKIDSVPILFIKNKTVQAYNYLNKKIYAYSDNAVDTIQITNEVLDKSRLSNNTFSNTGKRDAVVYYDKNDRIVVFAAAYDEQGKKNLVANFVGAMKGIDGPKKDEIINRQLCHFFRADVGFGMAIAMGLGVNVDAAMPKQHTLEPQEASVK